MKRTGAVDKSSFLSSRVTNISDDAIDRASKPDTAIKL